MLSDQIEISATVVVYNEDVKQLQKTVDCFLKTSLIKKLYIIDNSSTDILKEFFKQSEITYIYIGENIGFGKAHNLVIPKLNSEFHLVLNPDVIFDSQVLPNLIDTLRKQETVAMISPKIVYPDGSTQYYCRKYPSFSELIYRRLGLFKSKRELSEYRDLDLSKPFFPESMHGCFMLFKTQDFIKINGFDERYFLYMEDIDICKKIDGINKKKMYYPNVTITHLHQRGSAQKINLLFQHLISARKYFKKWKN